MFYVIVRLCVIFIFMPWDIRVNHILCVCVALPTGCQVSGPWDGAAIDGLSELVQDLRLCSQALNQQDRQALKQSWRDSHALFLDRNGKCLLSSAISAWRGESTRAKLRHRHWISFNEDAICHVGFVQLAVIAWGSTKKLRWRGKQWLNIHRHSV